MSKKVALPLDDAEDDAELARRIAVTARTSGIPSLTPTSLAPPHQVGVRRPIKLEVTDALFESLTVAAAQKKVTKRYLILAALRDAGYSVADADFIEDGRRLRGSRRA